MGGMDRAGYTGDGPVLTDNQRRVLLADGADPQRLDQGVLSPAEQNLLTFLAFAEDFMAGRYPGEQFAFTGLNTCMIHQTSVVLYAQPASRPEASIAVRVARDGDGGLSATESYFNLLRQDELNAYVDGLMGGMGFDARSDLALSALTDVLADPAQPLKDLLSGGLTVTVSGFVFMRPPARAAQRRAEIERTLQEAGLAGAFSLREVTVDPAAAAGAPRTDLSFVAEKTLIYLPGRKGAVN